MNDIRFDAVVGKLEDIGITEACVEFSEWHSKQGVNLVFYGDETDIRNISLSRDELHSIVVLAIATQFVDMKSAEMEANKLIEDSKNRKQWTEEKKTQMSAPHFLTHMGDYNLLTEDLELTEKEMRESGKI